MCELPLSDSQLAEKFKRECNEQFHILVRMHLSFVLDLNTQENEALGDRNKIKKWSLVPFSKKKLRAGTDGAPLTQEGISQVYQLIEFLKKENNIKSEGIFRRTGSLSRQQELRNVLLSGITVDLDDSNYSIHDCASVLKGFLAELPEPLLTEAHYPAYCQIAELCLGYNFQQNGKLLVALQLLFLLLPNENKVLFKSLLELLNRTASFEEYNRMSAENLAKLFTPHLLCPRKLTPEQLHGDAQSLFAIVTFMIRNYTDLFLIPHQLIVDFRARYQKSKLLNESVGDTANTVFTFVDRAKTAEENQTNTTETALAQLYAHIQSLPESSKKRKLVKQFNKENGHGTPLQTIRSGVVKNKSLGDSIKKHIFHKTMAKHLKKGVMRAHNGGATPNTPNARATLFCTECTTESDEDDVSSPKDVPTLAKKVKSSPILFNLEASTPGGFHSNDAQLFTPENKDARNKSMSPITRSTQRMSRAMQESMMTPRSRKPVLLVSGTNITSLAKAEPSELPELSEEVPSNDDESLSDTFKEYLSGRSMQTTANACDSSFSSHTDDFNSDCVENLSESKMSESLRMCLDGEEPSEEKQLVLKPKQFDENGQAIVFETSF